MNAKIFYEQPVNELVRVCLRLDHVFKQIQALFHREKPQNARVVVKLIMEVLNLLDRPDIKSKLIKEFNRHIINFNRFQNTSEVDEKTLNKTIKKFDQSVQYFLNTNGKFMQHLRENNFLSRIRQNLLTPGGDSCIDSPEYHYWLGLPWEVQEKQISYWIGQFTDIKHAIHLLLETIRNSATSTICQAEKGFYHTQFDTPVSPQLIRVALDSGLKIFPEISVGKHHMSVRFLIPNLENRPQQTEENFEFELTCCAI